MMKRSHIMIISLILCTYVMSCKGKEENDNSTFMKVNEDELQVMMNAIEIKRVQLLDVQAGTKAYLLKVKDSVTNEQYFITSPRAAFYEQHGVGVPNYYKSSDSLYIGSYFKVITSPGEYKSGLHESSNMYIVFDKDTLGSYSSNKNPLPLYHGENLFELMNSKR